MRWAEAAFDKINDMANITDIKRRIDELSPVQF